ncbi:polysaccharide deacetylase family protein [Salidesulfovibrio brasiliensis]|uniref:polysaccharide deacetylase family protein n=1 Tax=Salidesulfovibrio brasiliensis TaxID=221711 RepID=UPI0006D123CD|nr:polysaccharide deacetylase family protein [Salidesulfovibrio brasiliensis]
MDIPPISDLQNTLDRFTDTPVPFWWRDDDAAAPSPALDRLAETAERHRFPCALSVIPARTGEPLANWLEGRSLLSVIQHGYSHENHAPKGSGAWELGTHRTTGTILGEAVLGRKRLKTLFGERFVPVMVPPWNRIALELLPMLPQSGFIGLSADAEGPALPETDALLCAHAHADFLRWKKGAARFAGEHKVVDPILRELETQQRSGHIRPIGMLTHHLEMDEAAWVFLDALLDMLARHPAAHPVTAAQIWQESL